MSDELTREEAYKILHLEPETSTDNIKKKYENYMRRARFDDTFDEVLITKAYDTIMGIHWGNFEPDEAYTQKGINKKKIDNFFYHYKRHLLYGVPISLVIITVIILIITGTVRYDYTITLLGNLKITDQQVMSEYYVDLLDEEVILIDYILLAGDSSDAGLNEQNLFKLFGDLSGGDSDLFIINPEFAKFLSYEGALLDLSPYLEQVGISLEDENILWWYKENLGEIAAAYKFGNKSVFNKGTTGYVPEYFCIPYQAEFNENTAIVMMDLIAQNK